MESLRVSGVDAPKLGLFAHITWELCLDGSLVRREGFDETLQTLRDGFDAVGPPAHRAVALHHFDRIERTTANAAHSRMRCRGSLRSSLEAG